MFVVSCPISLPVPTYCYNTGLNGHDPFSPVILHVYIRGTVNVHGVHVVLLYCCVLFCIKNLLTVLHLYNSFKSALYISRGGSRLILLYPIDGGVSEARL